MIWECLGLGLSEIVSGSVGFSSPLTIRTGNLAIGPIPDSRIDSSDGLKHSMHSRPFELQVP